MEPLFAMVVVSVLIGALYAAMTSSVSLVRKCQENERATQILTEKTEVIRLYNWDQINNPTFVPTNFTLPFDPLATNSTAFFTGKVSIAQAPISESYSNSLLAVTVRLQWTSGKILQTRKMSTYVAKYGLQSYIFR